MAEDYRRIIINGCSVCMPDRFTGFATPRHEGHVRVGYGDWRRYRAYLDGEYQPMTVEVCAGPGGYGIVFTGRACYCGSGWPGMQQIIQDGWTVQTKPAATLDSPSPE